VDNPGMTSAPQWDIFCQVIDNHGDLGVCWRLSRQLAGRGQRVRLWVDDASALRWMAPAGCPGVEVRAWTQPLDVHGLLPPGDVLVEAFGCAVPAAFLGLFKSWAQSRQTAWVDLEYLSAEAYVPRSHALPSPVMHGPAAGLTRYFFYPGFTPQTGGLLREPDLLQRQSHFDTAAWLQQQGLAPSPDSALATQLVSLFCYEPTALPALLERLARQAPPVRLLVTAGRASAAVQACAVPAGLKIDYLPYLTQDDYDHLLWSCTLNFVRGEDSLVRALWAGRPFVWHIYPQQDNAHHAKLEAFLDAFDAPDSLRRFHRSWNALDERPLEAPALADWREWAGQVRAGLLAQTDLVSRLLEFVAGIPRSNPVA
jgi:uncharacterized repeat protein (TIGR03837 family)